MPAVVVEISLFVTQDLRVVCTEITARYHRQVVWIRVVVEVSEIAEVRPLLCEALQKIVLNGRIYLT